MFLRWIDSRKAETWAEMVRVDDFNDTPVYIDYRLEPYFRGKPIELEPKGFGLLRNLKLKPDKEFSQFVTNLLDDAFDQPHEP